MPWIIEAWMGLPYKGRAEASGWGEGQWPGWWGEGVHLRAIKSHTSCAIQGTLSDGTPWPVVWHEVGVVMRHVRDGGWCWKIRFGHGVEVIDPTPAQIEALRRTRMF